MHIYFLSKDPQEIAQSLTDRHLKRAIVDTSQILSTVVRIIEGNKKADELHLYKSVYAKHQITFWVAQTYGNYNWMIFLLSSLIQEYQFRFKRPHPVSLILQSLPDKLSNFRTPSNKVTPFPQTFPDQYKTEDTIISYRLFYCSEKLYNPSWTGRQKPDWMESYGI